MMTPIEQKQQNEQRIAELSQSISLWLETQPTKEVQQKIEDLTDYVAHRMIELELQGQREKIEQMEKVLELLKK